MIPRAALAVGLAALVIAFALGAARPAHRLAGSNGVGNREFVAVVEAQRVLCQHESGLPAGTGRLRLTIGTYGRPGPELRISIGDEDDARIVPRGRLRRGWQEGVVDLPLGAAVRDRASDVRVCIANRGSGRVAVAGTVVDPDAAARVAGRPARGRVRLEYVRAQHTTAWDLREQVVSRMTIGRGLWGGLAPWLVIGLVLLAALGALRALLAAVARS